MIQEINMIEFKEFKKKLETLIYAIPNYPHFTIEEIENGTLAKVKMDSQNGSPFQEILVLPVYDIVERHFMEVVRAHVLEYNRAVCKDLWGEE